jgi:tRNA wybutosine-synthesizing protein 3
LTPSITSSNFTFLCNFIAKTKNFFTASSCAGRITLVGLDKKETKKESAFYRKWHRKVKFEEVMEGVKNFDGEVLWFKQEPIIFHLGTNNLENSKKILAICEKAGIKRAGIKVAKEGKFIIEMVGTHNINAPLKEEGKIIANEDYIKYLVKKGNEKFDKNQKMLKRFEKEIKKELK